MSSFLRMPLITYINSTNNVISWTVECGLQPQWRFYTNTKIVTHLAFHIYFWWRYNTSLSPLEIQRVCCMLRVCSNFKQLRMISKHICFCIPIRNLLEKKSLSPRWLQSHEKFMKNWFGTIFRCSQEHMKRN